MKTLKLSHSIINAWKQGRFEDAISMYTGGQIPLTPAIELGRLYDEKWDKEVSITSSLPKEFGGGPLESPRTQIKYQLVIPFSEEYQILLRGVPDVITDTEIIDFKCGRTEAINYISSRQLDYYSLFVPDRKIGKYLCYNPYTMKITIGVKFLDEELRKDALNEIVTYSGEILQYLLANKLFRNWEVR